MAKTETDAELALAVRQAMDALCKRMWEASEGGLWVKCEGFHFFYGSKEVQGPKIEISRSF